MAYYYLDSDAKGADGGTGDVADPFVTTGANVIQYALDNVTQGARGDTFYISGGSEVDAAGTNLDFAAYTPPSNEQPLTIVAFETTPGDNGRITYNNNGASTITSGTTDGISFENFDFYGGTGTFQVYLDSWSNLINCSVDCTGSDHGVSLGFSGGLGGNMIGCHVYNVVSTGYALIHKSGNILGNTFETAGRGIIPYFYGCTVAFNTIYTTTTLSTDYAIRPYTADNCNIHNNSIYGSGAVRGYGIYLLSTGNESMRIHSNYIEGLSGTGATAIHIDTGSSSILLANNRWYNCTNGIVKHASHLNYDDDNTVTTASGFVNAASKNFYPTDELIGKAWPNVGINDANYYQQLAIGSVQTKRVHIPRMRTF